jgi:DNA polymerase-3 subunit alpha
VHLHVHTEYSILDGAARVAPLVAEAAKLEMPAVGMTDHGNMFGAYEFYQQATKAGVKPVIGIEAYVAPESRHLKRPVLWGQNRQHELDPNAEGGDVSGGGAYTHMTMLAENEQGLRNLFRLSSLASIEGFYRQPRMDAELIAAHAEGIIATTGCPSGEVQTRLRLGQPDKAVEAAARLQDIFGRDNFFLELMDHGLPIERSVRHGLLDVGRKLRLPPLATNDSHYVTSDQASAHEVLLCVGTGRNLDDPKRFRFEGGGYYLKTAGDLRELWDGQVPGACDNTLLIAERVGSYETVFGHVERMPEFPVAEGATQAGLLRAQVRAGTIARFGSEVPAAVAERVEYELGVIEQMGFPSYFLVVADICQEARRRGIPVGPGRGSATGSMVAYVLRITELDPIEHGLLFERFLNPERISMPDIDLDFDERGRGDMIRYVTDKYGDDRVCQIITYGTIKAKAAVKDSCRVLGHPYALGDRITKVFPPAVNGKEITLSVIFDEEHERYGETAELRALREAEPEVARIIDTARGIEGLVRSIGVHAAGVILSSQPLLDVMPIHRRQNDGAIISGFSFLQAEAMGLLKMDFLGLRNLTVISDAIAGIKASCGVTIDLSTLPTDDKKTYQMLARGDTLGVFQLDGGPLRSLLRLIAPTSFGDVAAAIALYRPGPIAANTHINYADRKNGRKKIEPIHAELGEALEPILGETYHLVVYQEQVMAAARQLAGYSLGAADLLRRAMGKKKKEILDASRTEFEAGMKANGYSADATQAIWDVLVPFAGYGFNKSHAAGYAVVAYWTAYLKANYPAEYMAALLTSVGDDKDKLAVYLTECRRLGIKVLLPDVNESGLVFTAVGADIRFGLGAVRNVGEAVVASITKVRKEQGRYTSFADFLDKAEVAACNKRVIESLAKAGAFDSLGHTRRQLVNELDRAVDAVIGVKRQAAIGQDDLFSGLGGDAAERTGIHLDPGAAEWPQKILLDFEREMLGLYVSAHPLDKARKLLERARDTSIADLLASERTDGFVQLAGLVVAISRRVNKAGNSWAVLTLEDLEASVEIMFFPKVYTECMAQLAEDTVVSVRGRLNERDGSLSVFAMELTVLEVPVTSSGDAPVVIVARDDMITAQVADELQDILGAHRGDTPVHFRVEKANSIPVLFDLPRYKVTPSSGLVADIKALLGPGSLTMP